MSEIKEIQTYFGRCRCCLSYGYLKNMWSEHDCEGETEIYGEMLAQCFALPLVQLCSKGEEYICDGCVVRLRNANGFKKLVLESQDELVKEMGAAVATKTKTVLIDNNKSVVLDKDQEQIMVIQPDVSNWPEVDVAGYQEIVFLEEEEDYVDIKEEVNIKPDVSSDISTQDDPKSPPPKGRRKFPKRLKQYSAETLRKCVETVVAEEMTAYEASEVFKVPRKTIVAKVKEYKESDQDPDKEATYKFIQEIKTILTYTNATPYKTKGKRLYCIYCPYEGKIFEEPNELRTHTRTAHANDRASKIEFVMRPQWLHEVLKLDIDNLLCNVCCTPIGPWSHVFTHLKDKHDVVLDVAYKRVIPYLLQELKCALCEEEFTLFKDLDNHMNCHYDNYICSDCGDTFVTSCRLKQHSKSHEIGKFKCQHCPKSFTSDKAKLRHEHMEHDEGLEPIFKCLYCKERFGREYTRHLHVLDKHYEKSTVYTCEFCCKSYTWRPYYMTHMKNVHNRTERHVCEVCGRSYLQAYKLREHMITHTGDRYMCAICKRLYRSKTALRYHTNKVHT